MATKTLLVPATRVRPGDVVDSMLVQRVDAYPDVVDIHLYGVASGRRETRTLRPETSVTIERVFDPHENPFHDLG